MAKELLFDEEARNKIKRGVDQVANAVKSTLGPRGRNVVFESRPSLIVTNDGVTIAREIILQDKFENLGADLVKEAAMRTNEEAGDGTTTATLLVQTMVTEGMRYIATGINPMIMKEGMKKASDMVVKKLKELATEIKTKEEKKQVATISANNDEETGELIANIFEKVGKDGVISIQDSNTPETTVEIVQGMKWEHGVASPYLITNAEKFRAEIDDAFIVISSDDITTEAQLIPVVELLISNGITKFVLIARTIDAEALHFIVMNRMRGKFHCVAVKAPSFGDYMIDYLHDIEALTAGTILGKDQAVKLEEIQLHHLGRADKIISGKNETIISGGHGNVNERIKEIKYLMKEFKDDLYKVEKLKERLGKLSGGVGAIKVGAYSETAQKEKKYRIEDALNATRAALEEGIVPGGGVALLRCQETIWDTEVNSQEENIGALIVKKALKAPLYQIAFNSGVESPDSIVEKVVSQEDKNMGYDARAAEFVNMIEKGIIDPVKVVRNALENAVATASIILTTNTCITNIEEKKI